MARRFPIPRPAPVTSTDTAFKEFTTFALVQNGRGKWTAGYLGGHGCGAGASACLELPEFFADAPQAFAQKLFSAAEPDPYIALHTQLLAGHDQRTLPHANSFAQLDGWNAGAILHQSDRARFGFAPFQESAEALHPFPGDGEIRIQHRAGSRVALLAILRRHRDPREAVGKRVRADS